MPYSDILKRSFYIVRNEPALWIMGIIIAIFGGGGGGSGGSGGNMNFGQGIGESQFQDFPFDGNTSWPAWLTEETMIMIGLGFVCFIIVLSLVSFVIRNVALAGLIYGSDRASEGIDVRWTELLRAGWSQAGRRLMGMKILLSLPILTVILPALLIGGAMAFAVFGSGSPSDEGIASMIAVGFCFLCLIPIIIALVWVLSLVGNYAARMIVLEEKPVMDALRQGWQMFRSNMLDSFIFSFILAVISFLLGMVIVIIFMIALFAIGIPLFFFLMSQEFSLILIIGLVIPAVLVLIILMSLLSGPLVAYFETAWTLVWQHLSNPKMPPAAPMGFEQPVA